MRLEVIIPYRNRQEHVSKQVPHLWKVLTDQGINFGITIVEQEEGKLFNTGMMKNIGYLESEFADYYCFHDVDMYAEDVDYSYTDMPTHLAYAVEQFGYKLPYPTFFGGVTLFDKESYRKINGYSNEYLGWSADDDDLYLRVIKIGFKRRFGRFWSDDHDRTNYPEWQAENIKKLKELASRPEVSGLNSLEYTVKDVKQYNDRLRTILVSI